MQHMQPKIVPVERESNVSPRRVLELENIVLLSGDASPCVQRKTKGDGVSYPNLKVGASSPQIGGAFGASNACFADPAINGEACTQRVVRGRRRIPSGPVFGVARFKFGGA